MFLEVTEILRCPRAHDESFVVCVADAMDGRQVARGVIGCPVCRAEFAIVEGVVEFGSAAAGRTPEHRAAGPLTAAAAATFLALEGRGGYVLLAGSVVRLARDLAALLPGVHLLCVNGPPDVPRENECSYLASPDVLPLRIATVRGVVLGGECAAEPWLAEGVRVLLGGLRLVAEDERASPTGIVELARGAGVLVGEKRSR